MADREGSCIICGVPFLTRSARRIYCGKHCSDVARGQVLDTPLAPQACALPSCETLFTPNKGGQRCCSERHGKILYNRESRADGRQANPRWDDRRRDNYHRRRAARNSSASGAAVLLTSIAERDKWRCGICRKRVSQQAAWPSPMSASLDHVIPLSKGGAHDPSNVQLAHLACNSSKGNRIAEQQLMLFG